MGMQHPAGGACGAEITLQGQVGQHVWGIKPVRMGRILSVKEIEPARQNHRSRLEFHHARPLVEVDGPRGANLGAPATGLPTEVQAVSAIDGMGGGEGLRVKAPNGLGRAKPQIEGIGSFRRACPGAGSAPDALFRVNEGGFLGNGA